ncbi:MAG: hypothetical protein GY801_18920 [bacterium]|nr:hypothetical protein [bacterium]
MTLPAFFIGLLLMFLPLTAWSTSSQFSSRLSTMAPLVDAIVIVPDSQTQTSVAGTDMAEYGYTRLFEYTIASQTATLFVLGETTPGIFQLGAINLHNRSLTVVTRFVKDRQPYLREQSLHFALCFLDHPSTNERLRYLFITYTLLHPDRSEKHLEGFRMENDVTATYTQVIAPIEIGGIWERPVAEIPSELHTQIATLYDASTLPESSSLLVGMFSKMFLADMNEDEFVDLLLWKKITLDNVNKEAAEDEELLTHLGEREELLGMYFDSEQVTFSDLVPLEQDALDKHAILWYFLSPNH